MKYQRQCLYCDDIFFDENPTAGYCTGCRLMYFVIVVTGTGFVVWAADVILGKIK